jgi:hypothetical protein
LTLILNGTDNSATTPAVTGTDTDTGVYYPAANQVAIATSGTQAMLANASQGVQFANAIGVGATTPTTSGAGITFPATQSASANANTLDDYEEGTWTPAITSENGSITAYTSEGTYTKIGNIVTVTGYTSLTTVGTAGGRLFIGGFPFTPTYTTSFIQPACPSRESNSTGYIYFAYINGSTADGVIQNSTAGAIAWSNSYKYSWTFSYKC